MRIGLFCSDPFYFPGGIQEHVKGLYDFLVKRGHYVKVLVPRYKKGEYYGRDFILIGNSKSISGNAGSSNLSYCFKTSKLKALLKKEDFDIIHHHNLGFFLGLQLLNSSDSLNIITIHTSLDGSRFYRFNQKLFNLWIKNYVVKKFAGGILISKHVGELIDLNNLLKGQNKPISIIPNGINLDRFKPTNKKIDKFQDSMINLLFVGRIEKRKGLPYLIKAFDMVKKRNKNSRLIIVGDGRDKEKCQKIVRKNKTKDVVFVGQISNDDLPNYYATADIFCSPALYGESFGIVLLEAMASGKPVVAFANQGYKKVLIGDGGKFLVEPKNIVGLARKLEILINDKNLRKDMGKWGIREAKKYSWNNIGKQVENFYIKVLEKNKNEVSLWKKT